MFVILLYLHRPLYIVHHHIVTGKENKKKKKETKPEPKPKEQKKAFEVIEPFPEVKKSAPKRDKTANQNQNKNAKKNPANAGKIFYYII